MNMVSDRNIIHFFDFFVKRFREKYMELRETFALKTTSCCVFLKIFEKGLTNKKKSDIITVAEENGVSPSGKATDSDSVIT